MASPVAYGVNRLENSLVTVSGSALDRPASRLSDRFIGPEWEDSVAGTRIIKWDQGSAPGLIDAVLLPAGHNLSGVSLQVDSSTDNVAWTSKGTLTPASLAAQRIPCTPFTTRYGRLQMIACPSAPRLAELFASSGVTFSQPPLLGWESRKVGNVLAFESESGVFMAYRRGATRVELDWRVPQFTEADRTALEGLFDAIGGGAKGLFLVDPLGAIFFVRWLNPEIGFQGTLPDKYEVTFRFQEIVP